MHHSLRWEADAQECVPPKMRNWRAAEEHSDDRLPTGSNEVAILCRRDDRHGVVRADAQECVPPGRLMGSIWLNMLFNIGGNNLLDIDKHVGHYP